MAFSSTEIILTSSPDSPITAYDPLTGKTLTRFFGSRSPRQGLTLAGSNLIAASHISPDTASTGFIHLYNWWSAAAFHSIQVSEPIAPIVATRDGSHLFAGGISGHVYTFSLPSGDLCRSFQAHCQPVSCLTINEDSFLLISGGHDGTIAIFPILRLLDVSSNDQDSDQLVLYKVVAHSSAVTCIALGCGCYSSMVSASLDGTCKLWRLTDGSHLQTIQLPCPIWCITMDPIDSVVYAGGSDGQVHVIPLKCGGRRDQGKVVVWKAEPTGAVIAVAMVNGNKNLVSASEEGIIRIWEVEESGSIIQVLGHERDGTVSGLLVATGFGRGRIKGEATKWNGVCSQGFCEQEVCRKNKEVEEMDEQLAVVVKDRRRAIDMLEVTIETYERLLGLLLREAKGGEHREE